MLIKLHMFTSQSKHGGAATNHGPANFTPPYKKWKPGHVLTYTLNPNSANTDEEWTIEKIDSESGAIQRDDCTVTIKNVAGERRELRGSTLIKNYGFKSHGDVAVEPEEVVPTDDVYASRTDVKPLAVSVAGIREFYPREGGREGTRILMHDKTAYVVAEPWSVVWEKAVRASASIGTSLANHSSAMREAMVSH